MRAVKPCISVQQDPDKLLLGKRPPLSPIHLSSDDEDDAPPPPPPSPPAEEPPSESSDEEEEVPGRAPRRQLQPMPRDSSSEDTTSDSSDDDEEYDSRRFNAMRRQAHAAAMISARAAFKKGRAWNGVKGEYVVSESDAEPASDQDA